LRDVNNWMKRMEHNNGVGKAWDFRGFRRFSKKSALDLVKGKSSTLSKLEWLFFDNYEVYAAFLKEASGCCAKVLKHLILWGFFMRMAAA